MGARAKIGAKSSETKRNNTVFHIRKMESSQSKNSPINHFLHFQKTIGNQAVQRLFKSDVIQAKLKIGQPGDKYEQEADRVADMVMKMPEPKAHRQAEKEEELEEEEIIQQKPLSEQITPFVQRQVEPEEEEKEDEEILRIKEAPGQTPEVTTDLESRIQSLKGDGQPLSKSVRAFFEPRFGVDFSQVRVHTDTQAAKTARDVYSQAFTVGKDIAFGPGQYAPDTQRGRQLLAHEMAHVVQQGDIENNALEKDVDMSAVAGVFSLGRKSKGVFADITEDAMPRLRSGLRLSRYPGECAPTFKNLKAEKTGNIVMTTARPGGLCELAFGEPGSPGMTFKSEVEVPAGCKGTLQYLQLGNGCLQRRTIAGVDKHVKTDGDVLDTRDPYKSKKVTTSGTVNFKTEDRPGGGYASGNKYLFADVSYKMWLLWKPDKPVDKSRVPLAMVEWDWTAKSNKTGSRGCQKAWTISDDDANGGTGSATNVLPTWTKTYPKDFSYKKGTC